MNVSYDYHNKQRFFFLNSIKQLISSYLTKNTLFLNHVTSQLMQCRKIVFILRIVRNTYMYYTYVVKMHFIWMLKQVVHLTIICL
jgi:hypothetical protein